MLKALIYILNIYGYFRKIKITERLQRHLSSMQMKLWKKHLFLWRYEGGEK